MSTNITLGQAFFGCDRTGYRVLGITDPGLSDEVMRLCGELGTPDGFSEVSPFLFSRIVNGTLFMGCCRSGAPDRAGRQTLFFHLVYAPRRECEAHGVNAFVLSRRGIFKADSSGGCPALTVEAGGGTAAPVPPFRWDGSPLAIVSRSPQNGLLEALIGSCAASVSWSAFAFSALSGYAVYAVSEFVARPTDCVCRDVNGKILTPTGTPAAPAAPPSRRRWWPVPVLIASLALNLLLLWRCFTADRPAPPPPVPPAGSVTLRELADRFPAQDRIDWQSEIAKYQMFADRYDDPAAKGHAFLRKLKSYVDFVNNEILKAAQER